MDLLIFAPLASILALIVSIVLALRMKKQPFGTEEVKRITLLIQKGASAYMAKQRKVLIAFVVIIAAVLYFVIGWETSLAFIIGSFLSSAAGDIGMRIATAANGRTANACRRSMGHGLSLAFSSGLAVSLLVVSFGLLGLVGVYWYFAAITGQGVLHSVLYGFAFGAGMMALFSRVGGGIYTKSADLGADLVGKVEEDIPEDDPRNPAVIADNVGDNVGEVAGMGSDLFESYVKSMIAAMVIGFAIPNGVVLPIMISTLGIIAALIGSAFVKAAGKNIYSALNRGIFSTAIITVIFALVFIMWLGMSLNVFYAILAGLVAGIVIGLATEYYTSSDRGPTRTIAESSQTSAATNIVTGISIGMESTMIPVIAVSAAILIAFYFAGLYGIAMASVGMLSTLVMTLATDNYGPVADNAAGIAEMAKLGKKVRERAEGLDAVGNTTAAMGKGFAIGSAALTAIALFAVYSETIGVQAISITSPYVVVGIFIGALLPFLFCSMAMRAVGKGAFRMVQEVRRQFRNLGILKGEEEPDYVKCIEISTNVALKSMILPGVLAVAAPVTVGLLMGKLALGGLLVGSIASGFLLALMFANTGGAWDNAKKYIESGKLGGKGSETHKASVIGDTVGDPMKDTAGPSLNILIKLMAIIALVFAPLFI